MANGDAESKPGAKSGEFEQPFHAEVDQGQGGAYEQPDEGVVRALNKEPPEQFSHGLFSLLRMQLLLYG